MTDNKMDYNKMPEEVKTNVKDAWFCIMLFETEAVPRDVYELYCMFYGKEATDYCFQRLREYNDKWCIDNCIEPRVNAKSSKSLYYAIKFHKLLAYNPDIDYNVNL